MDSKLTRKSPGKDNERVGIHNNSERKHCYFQESCTAMHIKLIPEQLGGWGPQCLQSQKSTYNFKISPLCPWFHIQGFNQQWIV